MINLHSLNFLLLGLYHWKIKGNKCPFLSTTVMYIIHVAITGSMRLLLICLVKRHPSKKTLLQIY